MTKDEVMLLADAFDEAGRANDPVRMDRPFETEAERIASRALEAVLYAISSVFRDVADKLP